MLFRSALPDAMHHFYRLAFLFACLLPAACTTHRTPMVSPELARQELMEADRAFDRETAARGIDGWMAYMSEDAVRMPQIGAETLIQGMEAVREADTPLFADPARKLRWSPTTSALFEGGTLGLTSGRWRYVELDHDGTETTLRTGSYLSWWRRGQDGRWQVIFDTGTADPPTTAGN